MISATEAEAYATDPARVASHTFYPFIRYHQRWNRFAEKGATGQTKERPIRYAARLDAYIYSRYRHLLSELYEVELNKRGLSENVLAYRRLAEPNGDGKCNIHFARDAFLKIKELKNCCVVALDISGFFESLDHELLKTLWCRLLGVKRLPDHHFAVFNRITKYAVVDKQPLYERLGLYGPKRTTKSGKVLNGYLVPHSEMKRQLCSGKEFRKKVLAIGAPNIIQKNFKPYGIPQGAPISDLLANLYLIDFDTAVLKWVVKGGGAYYRYSDDILIIMPGSKPEGMTLMADAQKLIKRFGNRLEIKEQKSSVFVFRQVGDQQQFERVHGTQGRNGLEYLGFRYDGRYVYLRDATLSNLCRKVARAARRDANAAARRYPDKDAPALRTLFNYERLIKRFGKVEDFEEKQHEYRNWTFWTYANRASKIFGPLGKPILRQLRNYHSFIRRRADQALDIAVSRRERSKAIPAVTRIPPAAPAPL